MCGAPYTTRDLLPAAGCAGVRAVTYSLQGMLQYLNFGQDAPYEPESLPRLHGDHSSSIIEIVPCSLSWKQGRFPLQHNQVMLHLLTPE